MTLTTDAIDGELLDCESPHLLVQCITILSSNDDLVPEYRDYFVTNLVHLWGRHKNQNLLVSVLLKPNKYKFEMLPFNKWKYNTEILIEFARKYGKLPSAFSA